MLWRATAVQAAMTGSERGCPVFFAVLWLADHFPIELLCGDAQMVGTEANELVACRSVRFGFLSMSCPRSRFALLPGGRGAESKKSVVRNSRSHALPLVLS